MFKIECYLLFFYNSISSSFSSSCSTCPETLSGNVSLSIISGQLPFCLSFLTFTSNSLVMLLFIIRLSPLSVIPSWGEKKTTLFHVFIIVILLSFCSISIFALCYFLPKSNTIPCMHCILFFPPPLPPLPKPELVYTSMIFLCVSSFTPLLCVFC